MNDRVRAILSDAETALKGLIAQELEVGRYSQVTRLVRIVETLSGLAETMAGPSPPKANVIAERTKRADAVSVRRSSMDATGRRSSKASQYPKFARSDNRLVKTGWSKKNREEYEHRVPREAVEAFARSLWSNMEPGRPFTMEEVLPVYDASGDKLPDYQVYLALAWLRNEDAIRKVGRNGYVLSIPTMDSEMFDTLWNRLPEQH